MKAYANNPRKVTAEQLTKLKERIDRLGDLSGIVHNIPTDEIVIGNQRSTVIDIDNCELVIVHKNAKPDEQGTLLRGYIKYNKQKIPYRGVKWTTEQIKEAAILSNTHAGIWDFTGFETEFEREFVMGLGLRGKDYKVKQAKTPADPTKKSPIKFLQLLMNKTKHDKFLKNIETLRLKLKTENLTQTVYEGVKMSYDKRRS